MDEQLAQLLRHFHFSDGEAAVYSALVLHGPSSAAQLSAMLSMHRTNAYDILLALRAKGFVSQYVQKGVTIYAGTDPGEFVERCMVHQHRIEDLIPRLQGLRKGPGEDFSVELHHGVEGLHLILQQIASSNGPVVGFDVGADILLSHSALWQACTDRRALRSADDRLIVEKMTSHIGGSWRVACTGRTGKSDCAIFCFGTTVCYCIHAETPMIIFVQDQEFADTFRIEFDILWGVFTRGPA